MAREIIGYEETGKRTDSVGLFWSEPRAIQAPPKVAIKREPPEPVWLEPGYLPNLEEARATQWDLFTPTELWHAAARGEFLVFDIEQSSNYFLVMFKSLSSGKVVYFEMGEGLELSIPTLEKIVDSFCLIGFNSRNYDIPILSLALAGKSIGDIQRATDMIIKERMRGYEVLREFKVKSLKVNHIDLIEVAPLKGSLKIYGGRTHTERMQDLPFVPGEHLSPEKIEIVRWYCLNDLQTTQDLHTDLTAAIRLRSKMGQRYGVDLRSKSDSQVAEAVISSELARLMGRKPERVKIEPYTSYRYQNPGNLNFKTPLLQSVMQTVLSTNLYVGEGGMIELPADWKATKKQTGLKFTIGETTYQMGIGGLHSCESHKAHFSCAKYILVENDVESFYPRIILNQRLYPEHLGSAFLQVYETIVNERLVAKATGDKVVNESLKITINGSFGKLGNRWSVLYSPRLVIQVTLTGQLSLLYLIEKIEMAGIRVISANTDGIVIKCPREHKGALESIVTEWENETCFKMEETLYAALLSRSVNDYMAVMDGSFKVKGKGGLGRGINRLFKNPTNFICLTALENFFSKGIAIEQTILQCKDIRQFISVRVVKGGGVHNGEFLGKAVRWYYATGMEGAEIVYAKTGNLVSRSAGAKPLMRLPATLPGDIDFAWYIGEAYSMLADMGYGV